MALEKLAATAHSGEILATGVTFEDYLERFAGIHCELVEGVVIKMSPATLKHNSLFNYLYMLLSAYFSLRPIGKVISQPFTIRLPNINPKREPDLLVVLNDNPHTLNQTFMDGPPDICIEIVSEDSIERDRGTKFNEYRLGGVPEYWIIDPIAREALFYRLNDQGEYVAARLDEDDNFHSTALANFVLNVPSLWQDSLPDFFAIGEAVKAMLR